MHMPLREMHVEWELTAPGACSESKSQRQTRSAASLHAEVCTSCRKHSTVSCVFYRTQWLTAPPNSASSCTQPLPCAYGLPLTVLLLQERSQTSPQHNHNYWSPFPACCQSVPSMLPMPKHCHRAILCRVDNATAVDAQRDSTCIVCCTKP